MDCTGGGSGAGGAGDGDNSNDQACLSTQESTDVTAVGEVAVTSSSVEVPLLQPQRKGRDLSFLKLLGELVESGSFSIVALILRHAGWAVCAVALKPACRDLRRIVNDTGGTDCLDWSELLVGVGTRCASHKFLLKGLARVARITTSGRLGCGQSRRGSVACACERFAGAFFPPGRLFVGLALLVNTIWGVPSSRTQSQRCLPWPHHRPSHLRSGRACPAFKGWSFPPCPAERSRLPMPRAARLTTSSARAFGPRCLCLVCWFQVRVAVCRFAMSLLSSNSCDPPDCARRPWAGGPEWAGRAWVTSDADWGSLGALVSVAAAPSLLDGRFHPTPCVRAVRLPFRPFQPANPSSCSSSMPLPARSGRPVPCSASTRFGCGTRAALWAGRYMPLSSPRSSRVPPPPARVPLGSAWCCSGISQRQCCRLHSFLRFLRLPSLRSAALTRTCAAILRVDRPLLRRHDCIT
jgi:hypothetical protein